MMQIILKIKLVLGKMFFFEQHLYFVYMHVLNERSNYFRKRLYFAFIDY